MTARQFLTPLAAWMLAIPLAAHAQKPAAQGSILIDEPVEWNTATRGIQAVAKRSLRVVGTASHPQGVAQIALNGARLATQRQSNGSIRFSGYLPVDSVTNKAEIVATTAEGERFTAQYNVTPLQPEPAATPQEAFARSSPNFKGKRWAVIVGVSEYRDNRIQGLKYADADAKAMYDFLRSERAGLGGFEPENIRLLLNKNATFREIRVALFDFLKGATEDDVVYIYFAGHGAPDADRPENLYLIPYDAEAENLSGTGLPMEDVQTAIKRLYARQVVVITDACHSAGVGGQTGTRALAMNQINQSFVDQMEFSNGGSVVFTASEASQYSQEGPQWGGGHGVFTHYILEGLKGAADEDEDMIVSVGEMMEWVRTKVRRETRNAQIPTIGQTSFDRNWPMSVVLPGTEIPVISEMEIEEHRRVSTVMSSAYDVPWQAPDSLVTVVGMNDSLRVRLKNETSDVLPGHLLTWTSSNPAVATVVGGAVEAVGPGTVQITAEGFNRRVSVPVRVYDRPSSIVFLPADTVVDMVIGEPITIRANLLIGTDLWLRNQVPRIVPPDGFILRRDDEGKFTGIRDGTAVIAAQIAGVSRQWRVRVVPPRVKIPPQRTALLLGEEVQPKALQTRPNGSVLGAALGAVWRSSNPKVVVVQDSTIKAEGIGRATLTATLGSSEDSVVINVLGDLLLTLKEKGKRSIQTLSFASGERMTLKTDGEAWYPALSPNGQTIAFVATLNTRAPRIFLMDADGSNVRRLNPEKQGSLGFRLTGYEEHHPTWTHDGKQVIFASSSEGNYEVYAVEPNGQNPKRLTSNGSVDWRVSAAPDGPQITFERLTGSGDADLVVSLSNGSEPRVLKSALAPTLPVREGKPRLLAGGSQIVYTRGGLRLDEGVGETLAIMDASNGMHLLDLVQPIKNHEIIFTTSPDGKRIAYHQHGRWKCDNSSVVVINPQGAVLQTIGLGVGTDIEDLNWGAVPSHTPEQPK